MITDLDAWIFRRLLADLPLNGEIGGMTGVPRLMADHLAGIPLQGRQPAWASLLAVAHDRDEIIKAVAAVDPLGPAPQLQPVTFATAADVRKTMASIRWLCEGWIPASSIVGIASLEGTGKTRFGLDICRRVHNTLTWPDGQAITLPAQSPSLWVCADGHHDEIVDMLPSFGLPDEAVIFPAPPDDPYCNTSLDDPETLAQLDAAIAARKPWALWIDSLTYATSRDLCEQKSIAILKSPLVDLAQRHQLIVFLFLHVSQAGQALGRRIKGITRTLLHLECPDPEKPERLRLWVEKSHGKKPPALGVTMGDDGNVYDSNPPAKLDMNRVGKSTEKLDKAVAFIEQQLTTGDMTTVDLIKAWEAINGSVGTFFNARKKMIANGLVVVDATVRPQICHLVKP